MINVIADNGKVTIKHAEGTTPIIMSELCCIVDAVCSAWSESKEDREYVKKAMIRTVADALKMDEEKQ